MRKIAPKELEVTGKISLVVGEELHLRIRKLARDTGRSESEVVRLILQAYFEEEEAE